MTLLSVAAFVVLLLALEDDIDVVMFRFLLLIEDSSISLASIACSRNREAPSHPPY